MIRGQDIALICYYCELNRRMKMLVFLGTFISDVIFALEHRQTLEMWLTRYLHMLTF
jgi:hypothetical protein